MAAKTGQPLETVEQLLEELSSNRTLRKLYIRQCPRGLGATAEAERLNGLAPHTECERCGQIHDADAGDIDEVLVASESLQRELADGQAPTGPPRSRTSIPHRAG